MIHRRAVSGIRPKAMISRTMISRTAESRKDTSSAQPNTQHSVFPIPRRPTPDRFGNGPSATRIWSTVTCAPARREKARKPANPSSCSFGGKGVERAELFDHLRCRKSRQRVAGQQPRCEGTALSGKRCVHENCDEGGENR